MVADKIQWIQVGVLYNTTRIGASNYPISLRVVQPKLEMAHQKLLAWADLVNITRGTYTSGTSDPLSKTFSSLKDTTASANIMYIIID